MHQGALVTHGASMLSSRLLLAFGDGTVPATIVVAILFGFAMGGIGLMLLIKPETIFRWFITLNPNSEYARKKVESLQASVGRVRFVGLLSFGWGLFVAYLSLRTLLK